MVFSSLAFLYLFLPGTLVLLFAVPRKAKNAMLLLASIAFYFCGEQLKVLIMLGEILLAYGAGRFLEHRSGKAAAVTAAAAVTLSIAVLFFLKYAGPMKDAVNAAFGRPLLAFRSPALPIGVSFYTFQCISYIIDVYRGDHPAEKDPVSFALYVSFFPQLIAGPIVRYSAVSHALKEREFSFTRLGDGAFRFTLGLGKKILIADSLYAFAAAGGTGAALAWLQSIAYLFYVYFDFSGYSDMAIGLAKAFGFDIPENFNYPLISRTFREFWRRWHISLGSWFRDYLYIPLGGSRRGLPRQIRNLLLVWALTGLWHGAGWNYVLWGLSFGILIAAETLRDRYAGNRTPETPVRSLLRVPLVFLVTVLLFVFFRFSDPGDAGSWFRQMFSGPFLTAESFYYIKGAAVILAAALLGATPLLKRLAQEAVKTTFGRKAAPFVQAAVMIVILIFATASLVDGSFSPFLYFRF